LVHTWNERLDPLFTASGEDARSYIGADQLVETGIFEELFSEPVRRLIAGIHPSALLYHCHCYEIAGGQDQPHIHAGRLHGWHRDWDTVRYFTPNYPTYLSVFILLSQVGDDDGPFEFHPKSGHRWLRSSGDVVSLVGPIGTAAVWNRSYFHRAAPNRGAVRRRILKLSIQPAGLPNDRIGKSEFKNAFASLVDMRLRDLVDERRVGTTRPLAETADRPDARLFTPTKVNDVTSTDIVIGRAKRRFKQHVKSLVGVG
jgi:hypothetical protein